MKKRIQKIATIMFFIIFAFLLAACCFAGEAKENSAAGEPSTNSGSDVLVVYFSRTGEQYSVGVIDKGNTAIVAKMIIDRTGADSFEILPEEDYYPYTYDELTDVAKKEQNAEALEGKTLIPFSTHEGSGLSGFDGKLSSVCPNSTVGKGLAIRGNDAQNNQDNVRSEVDEWLSELGF